MEVFFRSKQFQKICNTESVMLCELGKKRAQKLKQRLMELRAATSLEEISKVPPPRCHELSGDRKGQLSVDLDHPYRLIFIPADDPLPVRPDGGLDWAGVTLVEILEIADTH
jgi:proteic killer suppression protein